MKTFELKNAKEVKELVNTGKAKRLEAMSYAIEKREGMKAVKIAGVTQYVPEDLTSNGLSMLRQTANAVSRHSQKIVRAQEQAYKYWKRGDNPPHSIELMN